MKLEFNKMCFLHSYQFYWALQNVLQNTVFLYTCCIYYIFYVVKIIEI